MRLETTFGDCFAYNSNDAPQGKSSEGEQNGQEDFEESEEDGSDQAVDDKFRQVVSDASARRLTSLQGQGVRALQCFSLEEG